MKYSPLKVNSTVFLLPLRKTKLLSTTFHSGRPSSRKVALFFYRDPSVWTPSGEFPDTICSEGGEHILGIRNIPGHVFPRDVLGRDCGRIFQVPPPKVILAFRVRKEIFSGFPKKAKSYLY
jgi:hypothetical protein